MKLINIIFFVPLLLVTACSTPQSRTELVVYTKTTFWDNAGTKAFVGKIKIWQRDSAFVQEVYLMSSHGSTQGKTTTTYKPLFCRYADLNTRNYFDYHSFSDTSITFSRGKIDTVPPYDRTRRFYLNNELEFAGEPKALADTLMDGKKYHRVLFHQKMPGSDPAKEYSIGLFPAHMHFSTLSLEKEYSRSRNWFLQIIHDYRYIENDSHLFATREVE
ncbi:MAG: hypothetical protein JNM68_04765, partial [Dinghuibacter sp.]|nr:hypothetical protein [Dinghuibacter sp.]